MQECFLFSTFSPEFIICRLFYYGHSDWCEVVSRCFDLHFFDNEWCWASFHELVSHLYAFFWEASLQGPFSHLIGLFAILVLSCIRYLCVLQENSLSVVSLAIIFSHSGSCLFTLLAVSFVVQKLLSLTSPTCLFLFLFLLL